MGREKHFRQISLAHMGSALSVWATLGLPPFTACVLSRSILLRLQVALQGNYLKWALGFVHFPGLRLSGSGSRVPHKGTDSVGPAFCALPRSKQLRWPGAWWAPAPQVGGAFSPSPIPAAQFPGCTAGTPFQVFCVSPLGSQSLPATLLAVKDNHIVQLFLNVTAH